MSRSKDALRKHVSYRHPGTPSPSENENRRKRTKLASQIQQIQAQQMAAGNILFQPNQQQGGASNSPLNRESNANQLALLQSFTSEMTIPTQNQLFHHHQQQQQHQQLSLQAMGLSHSNVKTEINNNGDEQMASGSH